MGNKVVLFTRRPQYGRRRLTGGKRREEKRKLHWLKKLQLG